MTYSCCAELPPLHISDGQSHPSLRNTNKKTSSLWAKSNQKETQIKAQLHPLCWTPWWQRPHSKTDSLVQPSLDNTTQALIQSKGIAASRFEWGMAHLVKPKSPPDRDWKMQIIPYAEMGWTDNVGMWGWTDNETPASLPQSCTHEDLGPYACRPDSSTIRGYLLSGG